VDDVDDDPDLSVEPEITAQQQYKTFINLDTSPNSDDLGDDLSA